MSQRIATRESGSRPPLSPPVPAARPPLPRSRRGAPRPRRASYRARGPSEATTLVDQLTNLHPPRDSAPDLTERVEGALEVSCELVLSERNQARHRFTAPPDHERPPALRFPKQLGQAGLRFERGHVSIGLVHARFPRVAIIQLVCSTS